MLARHPLTSTRDVRRTRWPIASLRAALWGTLLGLAIYLALLVVHVAKFRGIHHAVPNIVAWAGRYPGFGFTWELTAINLPAIAINRVPALRGKLVMNQRIRAQRRPPPTPADWNPGAWVAVGALGYAIAGAIAGVVCATGARFARARIPTSARSAPDSPPALRWHGRRPSAT